MGDNGLGIYLQSLPVDLSIDYARKAEEAGFRSVWLSEIVFGDAIVPATAIALATERIDIATGIVGLWARSPVTTAMTAANLHRVADGRFVLGVGLQSRTYVDNWHGLTYERPLQAIREWASIVRPILDGGVADVEGEIFRTRGFRLLAQPAETRPRLVLAAIGPKMCQLAGELFDGVLGYFASEAYVREVVIPNLRIGAERAGRSLDGFQIAIGFPSLVSEGEEGLQQVKGQVAMFCTATKSSPSYVTSVRLAGFERELEEVTRLVGAGDVRGAIAAIPDEMADALTIAGSPDHVRSRIAAYRDAGVTTVVLNPSAPDVWFALYEGHFPEGAEMPAFDFPAFLGVVERTIGGLRA
ncbi:MAG: LLM class flavin-dependent oxidoreductase [Actinobacteria bacterium]|nr:LLM class flavin-dependent oxidoreductase [Actinomycetota bacterium]